ncbi:MAG: mechanosensitive ion channel family protein [Alphaproteobacteria bacterium]|nr:mechanosensitive ion channel family protein [Alphaproteobacteria bacterium]
MAENTNPQILTDPIDFKDGFALAYNTVENWATGFYAMLPNLVVGVTFLCIFAILSYAIAHLIRKYFERKNRIDLGNILGDLGFWGFIIIGSLISLTIIMPSLKPSDLLASLGIGSIAAGFAFKEILQNWLAGLLILLRMPFRRGDQIQVLEAEGTVMRIEPRATIIRTYDGRDIVVPNTMIFNNMVLVHTSQPQRRVEMDLTVGYDYEVRHITQIIQMALINIEEILDDPLPQVMCWELGSTSLGIKLRWWIDSERSEEVISRARAVQAIKEAFEANDIDPTDPQLIYYQSANKLPMDDDKKPQSAASRRDKANSSEIIVSPLPPPNFEASSADPESETPKIDEKSKTMLSDDQ